jgi:hypothetical protein
VTATQRCEQGLAARERVNFSYSMAPTPPATTEPASACGVPVSLDQLLDRKSSYAREGHHVLSQLFDWQRSIYHNVYFSNVQAKAKKIPDQNVPG